MSIQDNFRLAMRRYIYSVSIMSNKDDGYLNAARFQTSISTQNNEEVFRYYYAMKANNPYNFGIPRQIRFGVKLDF